MLIDQSSHGIVGNGGRVGHQREGPAIGPEEAELTPLAMVSPLDAKAHLVHRPVMSAAEEQEVVEAGLAT